MYRKAAERNSGRSPKGRTAVLSLIVATIILTNCLVLLILPEGSAADSGQCGDDLTWDYDPDTRNLTISGTGEMWNDGGWPWQDGTFEIETIEIGSGVTSIGDRAFYFCGPLTSVDIPDSVEYIGGYAFYETSLTTVNIPASVTSIGNSVFDGCESLESINVDESNPNYSSQDGVLFNKAMTKLIIYPAGKTDKNFVIPDTVTTTESNVSIKNPYIESLVISNSMSSITTVLKYCTSLTEVSIPASVTSIRSDAFDGCASLTSINVDEANTTYCSVDGVLFDKAMTNIMAYPAGRTDTSYTIPDSVVIIGSYAFANSRHLEYVTIPNGVTTVDVQAFVQCVSLTSINIPDTVQFIGNYAFYNCVSLTSIDIPSSVWSINNTAFENNYSMESINVDEANTKYCSVDGVLFNKAMTRLITYPAGKTDATFTIPDSVEYVFDYSLDGCASLTSINVDESNTQYCSVDGVLFNKAMTRLITYPAGKTDISYTIPDSVTDVRSGAFSRAENLKSIFVDTNNPAYKSVNGYLTNKSGGIVYACPAGKETCIIAPEVTHISSFAFTGNCLVEIMFENDKTVALGPTAVIGCDSLEKIVIKSCRSLNMSRNSIVSLDDNMHSITVVCPDDFVVPFDAPLGSFVFSYESPPKESSTDAPDAPAVDPKDDSIDDTSDPQGGLDAVSKEWWQLPLYVPLIIIDALIAIGITLFRKNS